MAVEIADRDRDDRVVVRRHGGGGGETESEDGSGDEGDGTAHVTAPIRTRGAICAAVCRTRAGEGSAVARVVVVGVSGSGKSTLARSLSARTGAEHVELDALFHDHGWISPPGEEFVRRVDAATAGEEWIADGNYAAARDLLWSRATHVVWLDLPRWVGLQRVLRRTAVRVVTRRSLWNGNRERLRTVLSAEHPIRWGWEKHPGYRERYAAMFADPAYAHLTKVRLTSPRAARRWLRSTHGL